MASLILQSAMEKTDSESKSHGQFFIRSDLVHKLETHWFIEADRIEL